MPGVSRFVMLVETYIILDFFQVIFSYSCLAWLFLSCGN